MMWREDMSSYRYDEERDIEPRGEAFWALVVAFIFGITVWGLACYGAWALIDAYWTGAK